MDQCHKCECSSYFGRGCEIHATFSGPHLTRVHDLPPEDALGRDVEVCVGRDVHGALSAQLEGDGRQVLGGGRVDDPADGGAPRVEDVVEALLQQLGRLGNASVDDLNKRGESRSLGTVYSRSLY